jgi:hypothetical protein
MGFNVVKTDSNEKTTKNFCYFQRLGALVKGINHWSSVLENFPYGLGAMILYFLLFQSELVPSLISIWGFIGAVMLVAMGLFRLLGHSFEFLAIPLILNEIVLAVWFIIEGINSSLIAYVVVGVLFITALASIASTDVFLKSIKNPDYLTAVAPQEKKVLIGVLLTLTLTASVVAIPIVIFPILKVYSETLALAYVISRIFEGIADATMAFSHLLVLTISREYIKTGTPSIIIDE